VEKRTALADWLYRFRLHLSKSQRDFADMLGVSLSTARHWEQGHRQPSGPARLLLARMARETGFERPPDVETRRTPREAAEHHQTHHN
jgi:transcriptional regulator with XRE-family HTH domain